jgi:RND family efflux transporter MFP subunit
MKKVLAIFSAGLLAVACSSGGDKSIDERIAQAGDDIKSLKKIKTELSQKAVELNKDIEKLSKVINSKDKSESAYLVSVKDIKKEEFKHYIEFQGNVTTKQNVVVLPEASGMIKQVLVKEGSRVSKGQTLAILDDNGMLAQLEQLKIQMKLAKTVYEKKKRLWDQNIGSEIDFLQAETSYKAQVKAVERLEVGISKTRVTAPFNGVIDQVFKEKGNMVAPGQGGEIFRIINLSNMYITASLPEIYLKKVSKNKEVKVEIPVIGLETVSAIRQTGNYINPTNRTFSIEVPLSNRSKNVKPNMTAKLLVNDYLNKEAIVIPLSIISENSKGEQYVYLAEKNKAGKLIAKKRIIETGKSKGDVVEAVKGLSENDKIIVEGARTIKEGQLINIVK